MRYLTVVLMVVHISVTAAAAQSTATIPPSGSPTVAAAGPSTLEIVNGAPMNIVFDISCDQGRNWDPMALAAGVSNTYYCGRGTPPSLWFRIITQLPGEPRREVQGPLEWRTRSEIAWDEITERWTLRRVSSPR